MCRFPHQDTARFYSSRHEQSCCDLWLDVCFVSVISEARPRLWGNVDTGQEGVRYSSTSVVRSIVVGTRSSYPHRLLVQMQTIYFPGNTI